MKTSLITGVNGQDSSYLSEFLLEKGYDIYGLLRRGSVNTAERIEAHLDKNGYNDRFHLVYDYMTDSLNAIRIIKELQSDEIYHLATKSHVEASFDESEYNANADGVYDSNGILFNHESERCGETVVFAVSPEFFRPAEVDLLLGNPEKAKTVLGWNPTQTPFEKLVEIMVEHDMEYVKNHKAPKID